MAFKQLYIFWVLSKSRNPFDALVKYFIFPEEMLDIMHNNLLSKKIVDMNNLSSAFHAGVIDYTEYHSFMVENFSSEDFDED